MDDNGVITVRDLRRRYGGPGGRGFDAVRGVTFSVRRGELFALLGTNGAGKTSAMEVLEAIMAQGRIVRTGTPAQVAASQPARICFELPGDARGPVPDIAGTRASVTGRTVLLQTADLQPALTALLGWANSRDLVLAGLDARPAWLAQAFHAVAASPGSPADDGNAQDVAA